MVLPELPPFARWFQIPLFAFLLGFLPLSSVYSLLPLWPIGLLGFYLQPVVPARVFLEYYPVLPHLDPRSPLPSALLLLLLSPALVPTISYHSWMHSQKLFTSMRPASSSFSSCRIVHPCPCFFNTWEIRRAIVNIMIWIVGVLWDCVVIDVIGQIPDGANAILPTFYILHPWSG